MGGRGLTWALVALAAGAIIGCGGGDSTSSRELNRADASAKRDLVVAYREANRARLDGLRCSTRRGPCDHPRWYPSVRTVQTEVGSAKLNRLTVDVASSSEDAAEPGVTYVVAGETGRESIAWAEVTPEGTLWVLRGSSSGYRLARASSED